MADRRPPSSGRRPARPAPRRGAGQGGPRAGGRAPTVAHRPRRRVVVGLLVSVVLVGFLLVGVFPTRAWLAQRDELSARHEELAALEDEQDTIEEQVERLQTQEEIERIAREEYGISDQSHEASKASRSKQQSHEASEAMQASPHR